MNQIKWFPYDQKSNTCSFCSETGEDLIRMWDDVNEAEAIFHKECMIEIAFIFNDNQPRRPCDLPYRKSSNPHIPGLMPFRWSDSERTAMAVRQWLDHKTIKTPLRDGVLEQVIGYMNHYVFAGCWVKSPQLFNLRLYADQMQTVEAVDIFIRRCLEIALDPL